MLSHRPTQSLSLLPLIEVGSSTCASRVFVDARNFLTATKTAGSLVIPDSLLHNETSVIYLTLCNVHPVTELPMYILTSNTMYVNFPLSVEVIITAMLPLG